MPTHTQCLHLVNSHYGSQSGSVKTQVRSRHSSGILQGHPTSLSAKSEVLTMAYKAHHDLLPIPAQFCLPLIHPRPIDLISVPGTHQAHSCSRTSVIALCSYMLSFFFPIRSFKILTIVVLNTQSKFPTFLRCLVLILALSLQIVFFVIGILSNFVLDT